jgi:hypothetical protein
MALRIDPRVAWQTVDGEGVVMDLVNGEVLGFNAVGSHIWSLLNDRDETAIVASICARFAVSEEDARRDLREFLAHLKGKQLLAEA